MLLRFTVFAAVALGAGLLLPSTVRGQDDELPLDRVDTLGQDSIRIEAPGRSGIDTIVAYHARDIIDDIRGRRLLLYGDAEVVYGNQRLTGHYIEVDFNASTLYARASLDSATGKYSEVPVFREGDNEVTANEIRYNFKTKRATLTAAESQFQDGFYFAEKTYRVSQNTIYIKDGRYTTCDAPHPHYYFSAPEMKIIERDKVFADQVTLNVADVPVFFIPFGVFFASRSGKQSGIILPVLPPSLDAQKGVVFEGLGFFWAGNEYVDNLVTADLYSKGGYTVRNRLRSRINAIQLERSQLDVTLTRSRTDPDMPLVTSWIVNYAHAQRLGRRTSVVGSINYTTKDAIRNATSIGNRFDPATDITRQVVTSNLSLATQTAWGLSLSATYSREQNILTDELTQSIPVSIQLPNWSPFASTSSDASPLSTLRLGYLGRGSVQILRQDTMAGGGFRTIDTRYGFTHQPSFGFSVRLGSYFSLLPSFTYTESWFPRRMVKEVVADTIISRFDYGFRRAGFFSVGAAISTKLYGIVQPRLFGINAIRHTIEPAIDVAYAPDYSDPRFGYFEQIVEPRTGAVRTYSIFEGAAGPDIALPFSGKREEIGLTIRNAFEAKVAQGDTLPDRKITLLNLTGTVRYNAAAPRNFRWSPISLGANMDLGPVGNLSASAAFSLYDTDSTGIEIPELLADNAKGWARLTSINLSFNTRFSDQGFSTNPLPPIITDTSKVRHSRFDFSQIPYDDAEFFGETVRGASEYRIPWSISVSASYFSTPNYNRVNPPVTTSSLSFRTDIDVSLTPTVSLRTAGTYNLIDKKIVVPSISLVKDLHCWELSFNWIPPSSYNGGYSFRLGIKATQLQDVQIKKNE